ncbi:thioesterase family protein [Arthrobacter sp. I2-34]|uniref:Thioesterase family protein n=1 Tax=Arthrobacter hankyongi TaxID=2904801 RepID=A0ABS9L8M9_9MICC|nr:thioesterase family protein [Arthrobacter hankyongi]MCG2622852.1 thioesterase family protein [Arthrobacter hankyongi]
MADSLTTSAREHLGAGGGPVPDAYYVRLDGPRFHSTLHSQGAWNDHEQHMAPASGLLVHEVLRSHPRPEMVISQVTFEILGVIPGGEIEVRTEVVRPGRTIELIEATLAGNGRPAIRAFIWRLLAGDTSDVAGGPGGRLRPPAECPPHGIETAWPGGYIASIECRSAYDGGPGRGAAWVRTPLAIVDGEPTEPVARFLGLVDTANGIAVRQSPREYMFPNVELTVHLFRQPEDGWTGLDTTVHFGAGGVGLTESGLYDEQGLLGRAAQSLTVRKFPGTGA